MVDAIIACDMQKDMNVFGTTQSTFEMIEIRIFTQH